MKPRIIIKVAEINPLQYSLNFLINSDAFSVDPSGLKSATIDHGTPSGCVGGIQDLIFKEVNPTGTNGIRDIPAKIFKISNMALFSL